jgi:hypothetical protein
MAVFWVIRVMMEAARTYEMLVNFYQTTRCYNPEDSHLCTHRLKNLKSYLTLKLFPSHNIVLFPELNENKEQRQ